MATNNRTSILVSSQVPFFVRQDHPRFIRFLEAYYEYLEQSSEVLAEGKAVERSKNLPTYLDIDRTLDEFADKLYLHFLSAIPSDTLADKDIILKNVLDFYRAKGTEKSTRFLFNILYDLQIGFYYPEKDILKASDGKWFVEKYIRIANTEIANVSNNDFANVEKYISKKIRGNTTNSSAVVYNVERKVEDDYIYDILYISSLKGSFEPGEEIFSVVPDNSGTLFVSSTIVHNVIEDIVITEKGSLYNVGDYVIIESVVTPNTEANAVVSLVSLGDIFDVTINRTGAGFRVGDALTFDSDTGSGADASVLAVADNNYYHPNTYNLVYSTISLEAETPLSNSIYSNLETSIVSVPNVDTILAEALSVFTLDGLGPLTELTLTSGGTNYLTSPPVDVSSNTILRELGILGKMQIVNPGSGYAANDKIEFINPSGYPGFGALGNVRNVSVTGGITEVEFIQYNSELIGGSGYIDSTTLEPKYPVANVISDTGTGAQISVIALMGDGEFITAANNVLGAIEKITILNRGEGYNNPPTINLAGSGDGTANAYATVIKGYSTESGRYINDDGFLSSYNFLQDRDYYQNYSYVIQVKESIYRYRDILKRLIHPSGMKLFSEYDIEANTTLERLNVNVENSSVVTSKLTTFEYLTTAGNTINIVYESHTTNANANIFISFIDTSEFDDKYYMISNNTNTDYIIVDSVTLPTSNANGQCIVYV